MARQGKKPNYLANATNTPQSEPLPGQVPNNAGGYVYKLDCWHRLDQFLILGTEGGTFYVRERTLTIDNANEVRICIDQDAIHVVKRVIEISEAGRAPKNDPAIFVLAMVLAFANPIGKKAGMDALPKVCRIGTHLFHFAEYVQGLRGWGRGLRHSIGKWYLDKALPQLVYQVIKYQQRDSWSHRDLLRLAHIRPPNPEYDTLFRWITKKEEPSSYTENLRQLEGFLSIGKITTQAEICEHISRYNLPREAIPTQWLTRPETWEFLLEKMPTTALIRNLATMTKVGLLTQDSPAKKKVIARLQDKNMIKKARIHPIQAISAYLTYTAGHGLRSKNTWTPVEEISVALESMFYQTFSYVEPTNKRILLALDVSGSMEVGNIAGVPNLSPRVATAVLAMVTAKTETNYTLLGFSHKLVPIPITPEMKLDKVMKTISEIEMGSTDCSLPMQWALEKKYPVDTFIIYTDNETWFGSIHPKDALANYRKKMNIQSQLIVVGMTSNGFSIADPLDPDSLDVVGFDSAIPQLIGDFVGGKLYSTNKEENKEVEENSFGENI